MTLTTTQKSIQELLHGDRQYQIPDFQRPYVWEEQQAETLVNDLLGAWRTNDGDYFLGSIVLVQHTSCDDVDIIDGQQRLTTLCILVSLLRHLEEDSALRGELGDLLLIPQSRIKGLDERPRLSVRECDREFFDTFIIGDNIDSLLDVDGDSLTRPSVRRIVANARAMLDVLGNPDTLMPGEISDFIRYLTLHVSLIEVSTDSYQAAHRIFSVLNTRGVPLSAADIFKARVLSRVEPDARARYAALWEQCIDSLGTENPDAFFGHLLTLTLRAPARRALIDSFDEQVLAPFFASRSGEEFIDEVLVPSARAYTLATLEPLVGHHAATPLELLRLYDSSDWKPAAMSVLRAGRGDEETASLLFLARARLRHGCRRAPQPLVAHRRSSPSSSRHSRTASPSTPPAPCRTAFATGPPRRSRGPCRSPPSARSSSTTRWSPSMGLSRRACRAPWASCAGFRPATFAASTRTSTCARGTSAWGASFCPPSSHAPSTRRPTGTRWRAPPAT